MSKQPKPPRGIDRGLTNYGDPAFARYLRRSFATSMGYSKAMLARPVVGIAQSASGFNNCHRHFPELIEAVKRGVLTAGGPPIDFPPIPPGGVFLKPDIPRHLRGDAREAPGHRAGMAAVPAMVAIGTAYDSSGVALGGGGVEGIVDEELVVLNGANPGTFVFRWAQNTSSTTATIVRAGSYLEYVAY